MSAQKEKLKSFLKDENEEIIKIINNELSSEELKFVIDYIEKLNTISAHKLTNIGHSQQGDLFVNCETGITYIK